MSDPIRILYVDDYPLDRELVLDALSAVEEGLCVTSAASPAEFQKRLEEGPYDLVLSDLNILGFGGLDVMEAVSRTHPGVPVIILTGTGSEEMAVLAMKQGAVDYVIKTPENIRQLPHTIRGVLDRLRAEADRERERAFVRLRESEALFRQLAENVDGAVWIATGQTLATQRLIYASPSFERIMDVDPQELMDTERTCLDLAHPDDRPQVEASLRAFLAGEAPYDVEYRVQRMDGQLRWIWARATALMDDEGRIERSVGLAVDVTERRQAEEQLRQSEARNRALLEAIPDLIFRLGSDGTIHSFYHARGHVLATPAEEFLGKRLEDVPGLTAVPETTEAIAQALRSGETQSLEYEQVVEGETRFYEARITPVDENEVLAIARNVTERINAERATAERTADLALLNSLNEALNRGSDLATVLRRLSRGVAGLFGSQQAVVLTVDRSGSHLVFGTSGMLAPELRGALEKGIGRALPQEIRIPLTEDSLFRQILDNGEPLIIDGASSIQQLGTELVADPTLHELVPSLVQALGIRSVLAVPLLSGGKPMGLLTTFRGQSFDDTALRRMRVLAEQMTGVIDRKRAEQALSAAASDWQRTFDAVRDSVCLLDRNGVVLRCNVAMLRLLNKPKEQVIGQPCAELVHGPAGRPKNCPLVRMLDSGNRESKDLSYGGRWYEASVDPLRDQQGILVGAVHIMKDITESRAAQRAVQESEARLRAFIAALPDLALVMGEDGRYVEVLTGNAEMMVAAPEGLAGQRMDEVVPVELADRSLRAIHHALDEGTVETLEYTLQVPAGLRWFESRIAPLAVEVKGKRAAVALVRDITKRKVAEEQLIASEERYRTLFDGAPISIWEEDWSAAKDALTELRAAGVSDLQSYLLDHPQELRRCLSLTRILNVNQSTLQLYEASSKEQLLGDVNQVIPPEGLRVVAAHMAAVLGGALEFESEIVNQTLSGRPLHMIFRWNVVPGHEDTLERTLVSMIDITDRKRAEEELQASERRLQVLFAELPIGVSLLDQNRKMTYANPALEHILDLSRDGLLQGQYAHRLYIRTDGTPMPAEEFASVRAAREHKTIRDVATGVITESGKTIWTSVSATPFPSVDGAILVATVDITELKRAEDALRESEAKLRSILDAAPIGIGVEVDRVFREVNEHFCTMLGYSASELVGRSARLVYPSDEEFARAGQVKDAQLAEQGMATAEMQLRQRDGQVLDVIACSAPLDPHTLSAGVTFTVLDVTESVRARRRLQEAERRFRSLLDHVRLVAVGLDPEGCVTYANPYLHRLTGYAPEEVQGAAWFDKFIPQSERSEVIAVHKTGLAQRQHSYRENAILTRAGEKRLIAWNNTVLLGPDGQAEGTMSIGEDITQQREAHRLLQLSEERYRTLVEMAPAGILTMDLKGKVLSANRAFEALTGYPAQELEGRCFTRLPTLTRRDLPQFARLFAQVLQGRAPQGFETSFTHKDGSTRWAETHVALLRTGGKLAGVQTVSLDTTERKRAREEIEQLARFPAENPSPVLRVDGHGVLLYANPAAQPLLLAWEVDVGAQLPESQLTMVQQALRSGQPSESEAQVGERSLSLTLAPVVSGDYVNMYGLDITDRRRARQALEQTSSELQALYDTALALSSELDPGQVLRNIVERAAGLLQGEAGDLFIYRPATDDLELRVSYNCPKDLYGSTMRRGEGMGGRVLDSGQAMMVRDYGSWPGRLSTWETIVQGTALSVPIVWRGETLGVLGLFRQAQVPFSESDVRLLSLFANQAAVALVNARLFGEAVQQQHYLEALQEINATLRSTQPLEEVLDTVARGVGEAMDLVGSVIVIPDSAGAELVAGAVWGGALIEAAQRLTGSTVWAFRVPLTAKDSPILQAYHDRQLLFLSGDPQQIVAGVQPHIPKRLAPVIARAMGARSAACVPLLAGEQAVGVLLALLPKETLADEERSLLVGVADQAGLAIANARLFAEVLRARERLQALSSRLVQVQEEERHHLAHELHDEIGQELTGLKIMLEMASDAGAEEQVQYLDDSKTLVQQLIAGVRDLSLDLRPAMLDDLGLLPALLWHVKRYESQTGVHVRLQHQGLEGRRFPPDIETALYRITQEALTNVARYAGAEQVEVRAWAEEESVHLKVHDRGKGFDLDAELEARRTSGLAGMQERAALLGGQLEIRSVIGEGTTVEALLPLGGQAHSR